MRQAVAAALLLLGVAPAALGFKDQEFKTCDMNPFCKRNRHRDSGAAAYDIQSPGFVKGAGAKQNTAMALLAERTTGETFTLELKAYRQSVVRMTLHEADKTVQRYAVPDVLEPGLDATLVEWESITPEGRYGPTRLITGDAQLLVQHEPFALTMTVRGKVVLVLNDRQLLHMEHQHASRQVNDTDDMWATKFKSHSETIRHGPTSLMWDASFPGAAAVYGIPEHATSMALRPTMGEGIKSEPYRLFNLDVFEYLHDSPFGLYGSIPFLMAHGPRGATGLFWLNAAEMYVDVSLAATTEHPQTSWIAETGMLDVFIMTGPTPAEVTHQYSTVTGNTYLPPLFSIGYHQCRWNYRDQPDVHAVDEGFDENVMPYDVLWLDIEHTDGKRYFTWDKRLFPEPAKMQNTLAAHTRKMVNIVDPHIKRDNSYYVHKEATAQGLYVKDVSGKDYEGWCWPGSSSYLDFTSPKVRDFWAGKFALDSYEGSTSSLYIWNDMNEPSVFNGPEITMPKDAVHHANWEHRDVHNLYGYYLHMATSQGLSQRGDANMRPFVLSRAFFSGTQRIGPIWTGDNTANWDHLQVSLPMLLTLGLSGLTFSGADVGGFFGNPDAELMVRWYQVGAFYPFFRGHAHQETKRREPWLFGEPHTTQIRNALRMRYNLLPYFYTQFAEAAEVNLPVMRPLFMEFPDDASLYTKEDAFLVGSALLVAPVLSKGQRSVAAQLPGLGVWYRLSTGEKHASPATVTVDTTDLAQIPVFVRGGFIVPRRERPRRSSTAQAGDPYTLLVALDTTGRAQGHLYEDDGLTTAHQQGAFVFRTFTFAGGKLRCTARKQPTGRAIYTSSTQVERIVILGLPSVPKAVTVQADGRRLHAELGTVDPVDVAMHGAPASAVVLRQPQLTMAADWTLIFEL